MKEYIVTTEKGANQQFYELIRCKDCKNAKCIHEEDDWWECSEGHRVMHGNGFCSWGREESQ